MDYLVVVVLDELAVTRMDSRSCIEPLDMSWRARSKKSQELSIRLMGQFCQ